MVLLTQAGGLAAFGYTAWQIAGKWFTFRAKNEVRADDASLYIALEETLAAAKADPKGHRKEDFGASAARSGHEHVFEAFNKLPLPLRIQFVEDLTKLAAWSGQANKVRGCSA